MFRIAATAFWVAFMSAFAPICRAESPAAQPPVLYEVQINGESFRLEANRLVKLESKENPRVSYNVAIRVAPTQRVRLNTVQFDYDLPAKIEDDRKKEYRTAQLTHELGFSVTICDFGRVLTSQEQSETLQNLSESVAKILRDHKKEAVTVSDPHERRFGGSLARGATIRFRDAKGFLHVQPVYVLVGKGFSLTCIAEFLDNDAEEVLPLLKKLLDSVQAAGAR